METFQYESKLLYNLGSNLKKEANTSEKLKAYLTNIGIFLYAILFSIMPVLLYMKDNRDNTASFIVAAFQIPGFGCPLLIYLILIFKKYKINEIFNDIEDIVNHRMKICTNGSYEIAIKTANTYVKFPIDFLFVIFNINNAISLIKCVILDLIKDEIIIENWYLPNKFTYVK